MSDAAHREYFLEQHRSAEALRAEGELVSIVTKWQAGPRRVSGKRVKVSRGPRRGARTPACRVANRGDVSSARAGGRTRKSHRLVCGCGRRLTPLLRSLLGLVEGACLAPAPHVQPSRESIPHLLRPNQQHRRVDRLVALVGSQNAGGPKNSEGVSRKARCGQGRFVRKSLRPEHQVPRPSAAGRCQPRPPPEPAGSPQSTPQARTREQCNCRSARGYKSAQPVAGLAACSPVPTACRGPAKAARANSA